MSLDSFSNLAPLAFITCLKVQIEGCVDMRLPSNNTAQQRKYILIRNGTRLPLRLCGIKCNILNFCPEFFKREFMISTSKYTERNPECWW